MSLWEAEIVAKIVRDASEGVAWLALSLLCIALVLHLIFGRDR